MLNTRQQGLRGPPVQAAAGRERAAEASGDGADIGQDDAAGRVTPSRRPPVVSYLQEPIG
jgi:hypothetical protein